MDATAAVVGRRLEPEEGGSVAVDDIHPDAAAVVVDENVDPSVASDYTANCVTAASAPSFGDCTHQAVAAVSVADGDYIPHDDVLLPQADSQS